MKGKIIVTLAVIALIVIMLLISVLWSKWVKAGEKRKRKWEIQNKFLIKVKSSYPNLKESLVHFLSKEVDLKQWRNITRIIKALKIEESRGDKKVLYFRFRNYLGDRWVRTRLNGIGMIGGVEYSFEASRSKGKKKKICSFNKISI